MLKYSGKNPSLEDGKTQSSHCLNVAFHICVSFENESIICEKVKKRFLKYK